VPIFRLVNKMLSEAVDDDEEEDANRSETPFRCLLRQCLPGDGDDDHGDDDHRDDEDEVILRPFLLVVKGGSRHGDNDHEDDDHEDDKHKISIVRIQVPIPQQERIGRRSRQQPELGQRYAKGRNLGNIIVLKQKEPCDTPIALKDAILTAI
jgi:hypothetical protein